MLQNNLPARAGTPGRTVPSRQQPVSHSSCSGTFSNDEMNSAQTLGTKTYRQPKGRYTASNRNDTLAHPESPERALKDSPSLGLKAKAEIQLRAFQIVTPVEQHQREPLPRPKDGAYRRIPSPVPISWNRSSVIPLFPPDRTAASRTNCD